MSTTTESSTSLAPRKRLFICCDGTWCDATTAKHEEITNVARFARCIKPIADDGAHQIVYYHKGPMEGATGSDIHQSIRDAYYFLCQNHCVDSNGSDEIYMVGFSRGAYAARALAYFISDVGLFNQSYLSLFPYMYRLWQLTREAALKKNILKKKNAEEGPAKTKTEEKKAVKGATEANENVDNHLSLLRDHTEEFCTNKMLKRDIKIEACGVWDTVCALNKPWPDLIAALSTKEILAKRRELNWVGSGTPRGLRYAFQALALNEESYEYLPVLWEEKPGNKTIIKQNWFRGDHAGVGGGHSDSGLAIFAFTWMLANFRKFTPNVTFDKAVFVNMMTPMSLVWDFENIKTRRYLIYTQIKDEIFKLQSHAPNLGTLVQQGKGPSVRRGWSDPLCRAKYLKLCPLIHFTVPILKACDGDKADSRNPLLIGFDSRQGGKNHPVFVNDISKEKLTEVRPMSWEKVQFFGWLLREWKLREKDPENIGLKRSLAATLYMKFKETYESSELSTKHEEFIARLQAYENIKDPTKMSKFITDILTQFWEDWEAAQIDEFEEVVVPRAPRRKLSTGEREFAMGSEERVDRKYSNKSSTKRASSAGDSRSVAVSSVVSDVPQSLGEVYDFDGPPLVRRKMQKELGL